MGNKTSDEKLIEKVSKRKYSLQFQNLMDLVPESSVFKKDETFRAEGVILPANKWIIGCQVNEEHVEYSVDSDLHQVYSIEANDIELPIFKLKTKDYERLVKACEKRHALLLKRQIKR